MMRRRVATVETPSSGSGSGPEDDNNKDNKQSTARAAEALEKSYATSTSETSGERAALEKALPEANGNGAPTPTPPPSSEEPRGDWRSASGGDAPVAVREPMCADERPQQVHGQVFAIGALHGCKLCFSTLP